MRICGQHAVFGALTCFCDIMVHSCLACSVRCMASEVVVCSTGSGAGAYMHMLQSSNGMLHAW